MGRARNTTAWAAAERRTTRRCPDGRRSTTRWTDEVLAVELAAFCEDRRTFPTLEQFEVAGRGDLRQAVKDFGGTPYWAERLGVALGPGQDRNVPYELTDVLADTREVIGQFGRLPNSIVIRKAGFGRLSTFIEKFGGTRRFLAEHGQQL